MPETKYLSGLLSVSQRTISFFIALNVFSFLSIFLWIWTYTSYPWYLYVLMYLNLNSIQYRWDTADNDLQTVDDQELMIFLFFFNNMSKITGLSVGFHASKSCFCFPSQLRPICGLGFRLINMGEGQVWIRRLETRRKRLMGLLVFVYLPKGWEMSVI